MTDLFCLNNEQLVNAVSVAIENVLKTLSGWIDKDKPDKALVKGIPFPMMYLVKLHILKLQKFQYPSKFYLLFDLL